MKDDTSNPMHVLLYSENFYPHIGGVESSTRYIAEYLRRRDVAATVVTETPRDDKDEFPFEVIRRPSREELAAAVQSVDVVYASAFHPELYKRARLSGKKLVVTYRDLTMICPKGTKWMVDRPCTVGASLPACLPCLRKTGEVMTFRRLLRPLLKSIISFFIDANVCTSDFGYRRFKLWRKRLIYNGIDTGRFVPSQRETHRGAPEIVFVGRLIPEKGCQTVIEAAALLKREGLDCHLSIAGEGPYRAELEALAERSDVKDETSFIGRVEGAAHVELLQASDIAVVPSLIDEPFGLTAAEAMSCALPVVVSDVGALRSVVGAGGLAFDRGDAEGLAERLRSLIRDEERLRRLGEQARTIARERYDSEVMAEQYYRLFASLAGGRAGRG